MESITTHGTTDPDYVGVGWTESYRLACSQDGVSFFFAAQSGNEVTELEDAYEFDGNTDGIGFVTNDLIDFELKCQYVRFYPQNIGSSGAVALELLGSTFEYYSIFYSIFKNK